MHRGQCRADVTASCLADTVRDIAPNCSGRLLLEGLEGAVAPSPPFLGLMRTVPSLCCRLLPAFPAVRGAPANVQARELRRPVDPLTSN